MHNFDIISWLILLFESSLILTTIILDKMRFTMSVPICLTQTEDIGALQRYENLIGFIMGVIVDLRFRLIKHLKMTV
jgi:hypothetical protein